MKRPLISITAAVCFMVSSLPVSVYAAYSDEIFRPKQIYNESERADSKVQKVYVVDKMDDIQKISNELKTYPTKIEDGIKTIDEYQQITKTGPGNYYFTDARYEKWANTAKNYMESFHTRDYRTAPDQYSKSLLYFLSEYINGKQMNPRTYVKSVINDIQKNKTICEMMFATDPTLIYGNGIGMVVRGRSFFKYTGGKNLPKGVHLGNWYQQDFDVYLEQVFKHGNVITWKTSEFTVDHEVALSLPKLIKG